MYRDYIEIMGMARILQGLGFRGWGSGFRVEGLGLEELLEARSKLKDWLSGPFPLLPKTLKHTSPHS